MLGEIQAKIVSMQLHFIFIPSSGLISSEFIGDRRFQCRFTESTSLATKAPAVFSQEYLHELLLVRPSYITVN